MPKGRLRYRKTQLQAEAKIATRAPRINEGKESLYYFSHTRMLPSINVHWNSSLKANRGQSAAYCESVAAAMNHLLQHNFSVSLTPKCPL
jgi:hypothetical protein